MKLSRRPISGPAKGSEATSASGAPRHELERGAGRPVYPAARPFASGLFDQLLEAQRVEPRPSRGQAHSRRPAGQDLGLCAAREAPCAGARRIRGCSWRRSAAGRLPRARRSAHRCSASCWREARAARRRCAACFPQGQGSAHRQAPRRSLEGVPRKPCALRTNRPYTRSGDGDQIAAHGVVWTPRPSTGPATALQRPARRLAVLLPGARRLDGRSSLPAPGNEKGRRGGPSIQTDSLGAPGRSYLTILHRALRGRHVAGRIRRLDGDLRPNLLAVVEHGGPRYRLLRPVQVQVRRPTGLPVAGQGLAGAGNVRPQNSAMGRPEPLADANKAHLVMRARARRTPSPRRLRRTPCRGGWPPTARGEPTPARGLPPADRRCATARLDQHWSTEMQAVGPRRMYPPLPLLPSPRELEVRRRAIDGLPRR